MSYDKINYLEFLIEIFIFLLIKSIFFLAVEIESKNFHVMKINIYKFMNILPWTVQIQNQILQLTKSNSYFQLENANLLVDQIEFS